MIHVMGVKLLACLYGSKWTARTFLGIFHCTAAGLDV